MTVGLREKHYESGTGCYLKMKEISLNRTQKSLLAHLLKPMKIAGFTSLHPMSLDILAKY